MKWCKRIIKKETYYELNNKHIDLKIKQYFLKKQFSQTFWFEMRADYADIIQLKKGKIDFTAFHSANSYYSVTTLYSLECLKNKNQNRQLTREENYLLRQS